MTTRQDDLTISTATTGTTTYAIGERGTLTGINRTVGLHPRPISAFVKSDETDTMWFIELGTETGDPTTAGTRYWTGKGHHVVESARVIDRDEFDRLTTLDVLRRDLGWR